MWLYLVTFLFFALAILGMSVGVIFSNRRIQGSCGGLASMKDREGNPLCKACTHPSEACSSTEEGKQRDAEMQSASSSDNQNG